MSEWFHAKVKFLRQMDNGLTKKITEQYLVDSMSFTECEARVLKEQGEGVREVTCQSIARSPIKEVVFYGDTDMWHKVKVCYSLMDEETEKEKKVTTYFLVNSKDVKEAYARTEEHLKEMLVPFTIPKVEESPIVEVYEYEKQAPKGYVKREGGDVSTFGLSHERKERRDEVKLLFGDKYTSKVAEWVPILRMAMKRHNTTNPFKAVIEINKEDHVDEITGSLMIATAVEMSEGNVADYESGEYLEGTRKAEDELNFEHEEECAFESKSIEAIDPTDGQAVAFSPMTLESYLEDIRPNYTADVIDSIRRAYRNRSEDLFSVQLALMAFTKPQREMIADLCANEAAMKGCGNVG